MKTNFFLLICICLLSSIQISFSQETNDVNTPIIGYNKDNGRNIVSFISQQDGPVTIRIYTVDGKAIISSTNFISKGENSFEVTLPEGIYILAISGNEFKYSGKFICRPITNGNPEIKVLNNTNSNIQINNLLYKVSPSGEPVVVIDPAQSITYNSALIPGNVISSGNGYVLSKGVCWNTSPNPTISSYKTNNGQGALNFSASITSLTSETTYYVRGYATNTSGLTGYSNEISFTTLSLNPSVVINNYTFNSSKANVSVSVPSSGNGYVLFKGVCWSTSPNPTILNNKTDNGQGALNFNAELTNLSRATTYYIRAYATNTNGLTGYSEQISILTSDLTTTPVLNIKDISANSGGSDLYQTNSYIVSKGVCWNTSPTPTINNNYVYSGSGSLDFTSNITGLNRLTTYYVRAYARYQSGEVKYGNEISFTTSASLPTISTNNIILGTSSATSGGNITDDGGSSVTSRGVCWSSTPSPTVANNKTIDGEGVGGFSSTISGITIGQIYYVRAYATNTAGTAYGNERKIELKIGDNHEGGKIAYILVSGDPGYNPSIQHGLIAAPNDQVVYPTYDFWNSAVAFCNNLTLNDKNDWRLPTIVELQKMYQNKDLIGGFATYIPIYWSSTNDISNSNYAMGIDFYNGQISPFYKSTYDLRVRAVRNF